jgi:hypothetical protein
MFEISGQSILALPDPDQQAHAEEATMRKKKEMSRCLLNIAEAVAAG